MDTDGGDGTGSERDAGSERKRGGHERTGTRDRGGTGDPGTLGRGGARGRRRRRVRAGDRVAAVGAGDPRAGHSRADGSPTPRASASPTPRATASPSPRVTPRPVAAEPGTTDFHERVRALERRWREEPEGITRPYSAEDVVQLQGSLPVAHTFARAGAERLRHLLATRDFVRTFGALTGAQAVQMVRAGLDAIYVSGWQVAGDMNLSGETYPDMSLYPCNSAPALVRRLNRALQRADQVEWSETAANGAWGDGAANGASGDGAWGDGASGDGAAADGGGSSGGAGGARNGGRRYWFAPILADAEAGFGGPLHAFELMKAMIEAGAAAVHFEDQLAAAKKCGHLGGKVLVPTSQFIQTLCAARLAADVLDVPTLIFARTDAESATLLTTDIDPHDAGFTTGERTSEGYFRVRGGLEAAAARAIAYAPYADLLWCETKTPDLEEARRFADAVHSVHPGKPLAYNCSPSFNWAKHLDADTVAVFQRELAAMGYRFQFITLAGWHVLNLEAFRLARAYARDGMTAYVELQQREFELEADGYTAVRHQREVGAGYFDRVLMAVSEGEAATAALEGSTEAAQFEGPEAA